MLNIDRENLSSYCTLFYYSHFIPVYLYDSFELIYVQPQLEQYGIFSPPSKYLNSLLASDKDIDILSTEFGGYLGCVHIPQTSYSLVIGPVSTVPYQRDDLNAIRVDYENSDIPHSIFSSMMQSIPVQSRATFLYTLQFISFTFDSDSVHISAPFPAENILSQQKTLKLYANQAQNEEVSNENKYYMENRLLHCVETGNLKDLETFYSHAQHMQVGKIAHDNLRQVKNTFSSALSIVSRAAMRGGLPPAIAYQLSDTYFQQMEKLYDCESVRQLTWQMQKDYTSRVAENTFPTNCNDVLQDAINYIRLNTRSKITTSDVAEYVGLSRAYLSNIFSSNLGFSMKNFILRCKLEEGKSLLAYSSYTISEISNFLCFSSQSHFQRTFRNYYGITPLEYRHTASGQK